ncbi:hypothetical protein QJS10_CPB21g00982 [Acorus calamus]|uniref:SNF2 N-terminal domain-containing protein n=1 Tax=Acorus calamus TaxID=4465 RepID=A0AAV9C6Q9_ACOCL|nr:hypothetical protein QJS10_CPB21g00982 [Acorus calamus]
MRSRKKSVRPLSGKKRWMIEESSDEIDDDSSYYLSSSDSDSSGGVDMLNFASSSDSDDRDSEDDRKVIVKKVKKVPKKRPRKGDRDRPPLLWEIWEEENARWIDEHENDDADLDGCGEMLPEVAEPSPDVLMPLLRFQKEWLAWALKQEVSEMKGGILADEMGMGKTIQAISLEGLPAVRGCARACVKVLRGFGSEACPGGLGRIVFSEG